MHRISRLSELAAGELVALERQSSSVLPPLLDWIPQLSPDFIRPTHLAPLIECIEAIQRGETVRVLCHSPPRGAKTETLLHAIPWWLKPHPDWRIGYCSYNATQARSKARHGMELSQQAGVYVSGGVTEWSTGRGGGCIARGVGEGITGQGLDVAIVDDPCKDRVSAESAVIRERTWDWFREVLFTRGNPTIGANKKPRSIIVNMARWHTDDLIGKLIKQGWRYICLPAISDAGESFWPEGWPVEQLRDIENTIGPYSWASLYQGQPRPRGGKLFETPHVWTELPRVFRVARGLDLSYTEKTSSDFSVLVTALVANGFYHLVDVVRRQERAPDFQARVTRHIAGRWRNTPIWIYGASGPEAGAVDLMRQGERGLLQLVRVQAVGDKFVRAQKYAASWNRGKVLVPEDSDAFPWVNDFVSEHVDFTGLDDAHDDQVDAGAAMHDSVATGTRDDEIPRPRKAPLAKPGLAGLAM